MASVAKIGIIFAALAYAVYTFVHVLTTLAPDFSVFYYSAKLLITGSDLYTNSKLYTGLGYPPVSLLPYIPFLVFPYQIAQGIWTIGSFLAFIGSVILSFRLVGNTNKQLMTIASCLAFFAFPTRFTFGMGQSNFYALFFFLLGLLGSVPALALAFIIKPHLLLLLPMVLYRRFSWYALLLVFVATVITMVFAWPQYVSYVQHMLPTLLPFRGREIYYNQGIEGAFSRMFPLNLANILSKISIFLVLFISFFSIKKNPTAARIAAIGLPALVLVEPLAWQHHFVFFIPAFIQLFFKRRYLVLCISYLLIAWNFKNPVFFTSHVFLGGMIVWLWNVFYTIHF